MSRGLQIGQGWVVAAGWGLVAILLALLLMPGQAASFGATDNGSFIASEPQVGQVPSDSRNSTADSVSFAAGSSPSDIVDANAINPAAISPSATVTDTAGLLATVGSLLSPTGFDVFLPVVER